ncbi:MAG: hypothetical protein AB1796_06480 [Bacillota bacterium]
MALKQPFTYITKEIIASLSSGIVKITLNPMEPIFKDIFLSPGDVVQGSQAITVMNSGDINLHYWIFADWSPVPPTTPAEAMQAAQKLQVLIIKAGIPPVTVFSGSLLQLYDKPPGGRFLSPLETEKLYFTLSLPVQADNFSLDTRLKVDILFVAES